LQEIVQEGNALHHCVGSDNYLQRHSKGETTILFFRKKEKPHEPFFTLEYRNQQVTQVQGKYNREEVPRDVKQAIDTWQKAITVATPI